MHAVNSAVHFTHLTSSPVSLGFIYRQALQELLCHDLKLRIDLMQPLKSRSKPVTRIQSRFYHFPFWTTVEPKNSSEHMHSIVGVMVFLWGVIRLVAGLGLVPGYWPLRDGNVPTLMAATVEPLLTDSGRKLIPPFQLDLVNVDCGLWFAM